MESAHVIGYWWYWISVYLSLLCSCLRAHAHRLYTLATTCRIPLAWALHPWGITPLHTKCLNRASIGWSTLAPSRACILSANSAPRSCISSGNTDRDIILLVILLLVQFLSLPVPPVFAPTYLSSPPSQVFSTFFYQHFTIAAFKKFSSVSMKQWYDTSRFLCILLLIAENREQWFRLTPNMK